MLEFNQDFVSQQFQQSQNNRFIQKKQLLQQDSTQILSQYKRQTLEQQEFEPSTSTVDLQQLKQQQEEKIRLAREQDKLISSTQTIKQIEKSYPPEVNLQQSVVPKTEQSLQEDTIQQSYVVATKHQQQPETILTNTMKQSDYIHDQHEIDDYQYLQQSLQVPIEKMTRKDNLIENMPFITAKKINKQQPADNYSITSAQRHSVDDQHQNITTPKVVKSCQIRSENNNNNLQLTITNQNVNSSKDEQIQHCNAVINEAEAATTSNNQQQQNEAEIQILRKEIQILKQKLERVELSRADVLKQYTAVNVVNPLSDNCANITLKLDSVQQQQGYEQGYEQGQEQGYEQGYQQEQEQTGGQQPYQVNIQQGQEVLQKPYQYSRADKELQLQIDILAQELENIENTQILLENKQNILKEDMQNQQEQFIQINQQIITDSAAQSNNFMYGYNNYMIEQLEQKKSNLMAARKQAHMRLEDLKGNIRVAIRLRPQLPNEQDQSSILSKDMKITSQQQLELLYNGTVQQYNFYKVFGPDSSQIHIFTELKPLIQSVLDGQNVFIGAIGQTSSGKTYTTIGDTTSQNSTSKIGLMPRAVVELYKQIRQQGINAEIQLAMLELYNDQLIDLINDNIGEENKPEKLQISKMPNSDFQVKNLTYQTCKNPQALINLLGTGLQKRHIAETKMNINSSRSHTIIYIKIQTEVSTSLLTFADLAGSERLKSSQSSGQRLEEAKHINKSLSALGNVIQCLARKQYQHIPFRDNKLTMLLQPCMSGNCKSLIICCLCPNVEMIGETYQTLQFAKRGSQVITKEE